MDIVQFSTRRNVMNISSIQGFASINGGVNENCKDVYFVRCLGCNHEYLQNIKKIDEVLSEREKKGQGRYVRIRELPKLIDYDDIEFYSNEFYQWKESGRKKISLKGSVFRVNDDKRMADTYVKISNLFVQHSKNMNESIEKNFMIKAMYWTDEILGGLFQGWNRCSSSKLIFSGKVKLQEYLFLYFLTLMGVDVLILSPAGEIELAEKLLSLSGCIDLGEYQELTIPEFERSPTGIRNNPLEKSKVSLKRPENRKNRIIKNKVEMSFEELALLASSVVMISIHDRKGDIIGTGSGIMIGEHGYILTNNHVASGGVYYSVRIENETQVYQTDEVIKYNYVVDLALIRIQKILTPISVYQGGRELVRGQKVVAIGSPLGLFNSVSDGIISGFRMVDDVNMIQFTAPISQGSSGGAVLNMNGELIGISTAGMDKGQNINLAVGYSYILDFIKGFR